MNFEKILNKKIQIDENGAKSAIRDIYSTFNKNIDYEKFISSGHAQAIVEMMEPIVLETDEHAPASIAYWAKKGMVKEFHWEDVPMDWEDYAARTGYVYNRDKYQLAQDEWKKWTSFVPVSAFKPENADRKYPLMFVLHGGTNLVYTVDGWGYVNSAAEIVTLNGRYVSYIPDMFGYDVQSFEYRMSKIARNDNYKSLADAFDEMLGEIDVQNE